MSDRDGNDHQSMPCGSVSSGQRRRWGRRSGSVKIMERRGVKMEAKGGREGKEKRQMVILSEWN